MFKRLSASLFLVMAPFLFSGCQQLQQAKAILFTRPSQKMPAYRPVEVSYNGQNWTPAQREWFYHSTQGSEVVPYRWFLSLEQPKLTPFGEPGLIADTGYLARFGFLPDAVSPENPDSLPVGFARDVVHDPKSGRTMEIVGLTCSACHTGQLNFRGKGLRIDGGTAAVDLESFQTEVGYAVALADKIPFRFDRFAKRVLGENASAEAKTQLRQELRAFLSTGLAENQAAEGGALYGAAGGFGRTDALSRIGNYVFGTELSNTNLRQANGPVKLPPLWDTSWFSRVQYNNSIQQPMTRNVGESLGVRAAVNLTDPDKLYTSTVNVPNLWKMEEQLSGPTPFSGLKAPVWPTTTFGPIDLAKAQQGGVLYRQLCQRCHIPNVDAPELQDAVNWQPGLQGRRFLKLAVSTLDEIGTDPHEAADFARRTADTGPAMALGTVPASAGLNTVTIKVRDKIYDQLGLTPEQRIAWNGYRVEDASADLVYRARPLDGIWATPPFLHNGSVPSLYELLLPAAQRSASFYTGSREFDPTHVGYDTGKLEGGFLYKTNQPGNSNAGHEFSNVAAKGVLGPELTDQQRYALIEYLKTL